MGEVFQKMGFVEVAFWCALLGIPIVMTWGWIQERRGRKGEPCESVDADGGGADASWEGHSSLQDEAPNHEDSGGH